MTSKDSTIEIELRNPFAAGILAWLIPGAGHFYQRRFAKGALFFVCILGTFFFGLAMGGGRVVYASLAKNDVRWQYFCQVGVGAPALPAILQTRRANAGKPPLFGSDIMRPPQLSGDPQRYDELAQWHDDYHTYFELGTLYTMIAGLLNILAIYDAACGPFVPGTEEERGPPGKKRQSGDEPEEAST